MRFLTKLSQKEFFEALQKAESVPTSIEDMATDRKFTEDLKLARVVKEVDELPFDTELSLAKAKELLTIYDTAGEKIKDNLYDYSNFFNHLKDIRVSKNIKPMFIL